MRSYSILVCAVALVLAGCMGSSAPETAGDPAGESTQQQTVQQDRIEIPVGSPVSRVLKELGPADYTNTADDGREIWQYAYKRVEYIYSSTAEGAPTLILGGYTANPGASTQGQPIMLSILFDSARKVVDFNFALIAY